MTESDCMKWLADFEEKTNTDWRVDKETSRILSQTNKVFKYLTQIFELLN